MEVTSLGGMVCKNLIQALLKNKDEHHCSKSFKVIQQLHGL